MLLVCGLLTSWLFLFTTPMGKESGSRCGCATTATAVGLGGGSCELESRSHPQHSWQEPHMKLGSRALLPAHPGPREGPEELSLPSFQAPVRQIPGPPHGWPSLEEKAKKWEVDQFTSGSQKQSPSNKISRFTCGWSKRFLEPQRSQLPAQFLMSGIPTVSQG